VLSCTLSRCDGTDENFNDPGCDPESFSTIQLCAQTEQVASSAHIETSQEFAARVTPLEKIEFDAATKAFDEHRYADSCVIQISAKRATG
jgi:hypothetical protein